MQASGRTIKFLYTIPNFHNPAGVTMSIPRRAEVLDICRTAGVLVLEDNPYGLLGFDTEPMRALRADEAEGVIYLGSFSKTFSPGMRVGWALAPHAVREKLVLAQESATLCPPAFSQMAVSAYLTEHDWHGQIKQMREMYRERRDAMIAGARRLHAAPPARGTARRRLLRLGDPAAGHRRQGDAAARGHRAGRLRARAPRSSPTASAPARCGCPSATRRPSGSARASAGSPACSRPEMELREMFGATARVDPLGPRSGYDGPEHRSLS